MAICVNPFLSRTGQAMLAVLQPHHCTSTSLVPSQFSSNIFAVFPGVAVSSMMSNDTVVMLDV